MVKNRVFAAAFRTFAFFVAISGLVLGSEVTGGYVQMFYYTRQSNLFASILFFYMALKTIFAIKKHGKVGSSCFCAKIHMAVLIMISFTLLVFWAIIVPFASGVELNVFSYSNFAVHLFTPLLVILDYFLFTSGGMLKKNDICSFALIPTIYIVQIAILGFYKIEFYTANGVVYHYPYLFMDAEILGGFVSLTILAFAATYIAFAFLMLYIDKKRR